MQQILSSYTDLESLGYIKSDQVSSCTILSLIIVTNSAYSQNIIYSYYSNQGFNIKKTGILNVSIKGLCSSISNIFKTKFYNYISKTKEKVYANSTPMYVNSFFLPFIIAIIGIENKTKFKSYLKHYSPDWTRFHSRSFNPPEIASLYNFPPGNGSGQSVGIVELDGSFSQTDLNIYFAKLNLGTAPIIKIVCLEGAVLVDNDASVEVSLDVQIIASICPAASITLYFAPNTIMGLYDAINNAALNNDVVSVSWGCPETPDLVSNGYITSFESLFASLNKPICISSGDSGSTEGERSEFVNFPASVPDCIACGGTTMSVNNGIVSETGWDGSGGGYSAYYKIPSYQVGIVSNANRGVPDISANADPASGYNIYNSANGGMITVGGTSAVAPLIASLLLLANETLDTKLPFVNNNLYKLKGNSFIKDITCCTKWDPVTGLGVISSGQNFVLNILNPITIDQPQPRETSEPTETIDTSEPTETIDTSEPIETIDTSEPTETIDTSEPTEAIDTSEQTEAIDTSEQTEAIDTSEQTEAIDTSEPIETIDTSEQTETIDTSEPIETIDTSEPTETIDTSEQTEAIDTSEPTETIDTSEQTEAIDTSEQTEAIDTSEQTEAIDTSEQTEAIDTSEQTEAIDTSEPTETIDTSEPTETIDTSEQTEAIDTSEQTEAIDTSEPIETIDTSEQTEAIDTSEPTETIDTSEPIETIDTSEPTETIDTSEPTETIDTSEPTEVIDTSEPTETIDTSEPTEVIDTSEPIETSKLIEMSEPSSYAKDWVRAYIQTKDENPYTEKKKREKIENGPKNLTDRPVVEPPVIIRVSNSKNIK
jgi:hypothetical protein